MKSPDSPVVPGTTDTAAGGGMLTRAEVCVALGISKTTLRRREDQGKVKPVVDARGVHLYRRQDVLALNGRKPIVRLAKASALVPSAANAGGELAAEIFDRLDREVHPVEIVKELRVHPDIVNGFVAHWTAMRKAVSLSAEQGAVVARLLGVAGALRAEELAARITKAVGRARSVCKGCEENRPTRCDDCMAQELRRTTRRMRPETPRGAFKRPSPSSSVLPAPTPPAEADSVLPVPTGLIP